MTSGSIYYHFLEARRREPLRIDDFTAWLQEAGEPFAAHADAIRALDVSFRSLPQLREKIAAMLEPEETRA
jgi:hypothetical protein